MNMYEDKSALRCWLQGGVWGDMSCKDIPTYTHCGNCPVYSLASKSFFEKQVPKNYIKNQNANFSVYENREIEADDESLFVFEISGKILAFEIKSVYKIERFKNIHRIPHKDGKIIRGLVNIGGELHICVCLRQLLGLDNCESATDTKRRMIVCKHENKALVFAADFVFGVKRLPKNSVEKKSETDEDLLSSFSEKSFVTDGMRIHKMNLKKLFEAVIKRHL